MLRILLKHYLYNKCCDMIFDRLSDNLRQRPKITLKSRLQEKWGGLRGQAAYDRYMKAGRQMGKSYSMYSYNEAYIKDMFSRAREMAKRDGGFIYKKRRDSGKSEWN